MYRAHKYVMDKLLLRMRKAGYLEYVLLYVYAIKSLTAEDS